jgi:hypothetical protein
MFGSFCADAMRRGVVAAGFLPAVLLTVAACSTPPDFSDGINSFSQAISAADATGKSLYTGAQKASQNQLMRALPQLLQSKATFTLNRACNRISVRDYTAGACTIDITDQNSVTTSFGQPGEAPPMDSLTNYASKLSAVVADQTCSALQTDATGIAASIGDIAKTAGRDISSQAGAISQIVSTVGCTAIAAEQLRILRTSTSAADGIIGDLAAKIADIDDRLYNIALDDAFQQANAPLLDLTIQAQSKAASLDREQSDIMQTLPLIAAIDQARLAPPKPTIVKIATLHHSLTEDLKSPTVTLARFQTDSQAFVNEVRSIASAAETLAHAKSGSAANSNK